MQTPTKINIPKHIDIGRLIGRDGRNLKPIAKKTGTYISVNTIAIPAKFEIKLDNKCTLPPSKERIKEAIDKLEALLKIKGNEMQSLPEKKKKKVSNNYYKHKQSKEIEIEKKERKTSEREMKYMIKSHTKSHGQCNKQKAKRDAPLAEY
ncbi:unnamed protein product [Rhizophagus irregularis]|uniref:K Homology domain-containing protein n=1 Tax=Rhizophagus irregularis TaxID=588596 RepID=A0A2N1NNE6_9GLOM|nr:hypothetical protein RhiirC2_237197 [Rhizophagus irregularis]CAB4390293.1 unnamed protein product [Rhizophagus irregularis]CAB5326757.1 unnamed protein product [Rhizophagus irregularis]